MIAWVGAQVVVPGIATEQECNRVAAMIVAPNTTDSYKCKPYQAAPFDWYHQ